MRIGFIAALLCAVAAGFATAGGTSGGALPAPPPLRVPESASSAQAPAQAPATTLDAIAHCESRGDPGAVSDDGVYRGKYQFDLATWRSVGGTGDPAQASEPEQDRRARVLAAERGTTPWPVCGYARAGS